MAAVEVAVMGLETVMETGSVVVTETVSEKATGLETGSVVVTELVSELALATG